MADIQEKEERERGGEGEGEGEGKGKEGKGEREGDEVESMDEGNNEAPPNNQNGTDVSLLTHTHTHTHFCPLSLPPSLSLSLSLSLPPSHTHPLSLPPSHTHTSLPPFLPHTHPLSQEYVQPQQEISVEQKTTDDDNKSKPVKPASNNNGTGSEQSTHSDKEEEEEEKGGECENEVEEFQMFKLMVVNSYGSQDIKALANDGSILRLTSEPSKVLYFFESLCKIVHVVLKLFLAPIVNFVKKIIHVYNFLYIKILAMCKGQTYVACDWSTAAKEQSYDSEAAVSHDITMT